MGGNLIHLIFETNIISYYTKVLEYDYILHCVSYDKNDHLALLPHNKWPEWMRHWERRDSEIWQKISVDFMVSHGKGGVVKSG